MKYREYKSSSQFDRLKDSYCAHCLIFFKDEDDIGQCEQTEHLTHLDCIKHNP